MQKELQFRIGNAMTSGETSNYSKGKLHLKSNLSKLETQDKKYVHVDFFEWLKNKQLQTGLILQDQKEIAHKIVQMSRKSPGPGQYNMS